MDDRLAGEAAKLATQAQELAGNLKSVAQQILDMSAQGTLAIPDGHMPFVSLLTIFALACFIGYYVVWRVTPALHSPLMAVTNAISSVIIVGALLAAGLKGLGAAQLIGAMMHPLNRPRYDVAKRRVVGGKRSLCSFAGAPLGLALARHLGEGVGGEVLRHDRARFLLHLRQRAIHVRVTMLEGEVERLPISLTDARRNRLDAGDARPRILGGTKHHTLGGARAHGEHVVAGGGEGEEGGEFEAHASSNLITAPMELIPFRG